MRQLIRRTAVRPHSSLGVGCHDALGAARCRLDHAEQDAGLATHLAGLLDQLIDDAALSFYRDAVRYLDQRELAGVRRSETLDFLGFTHYCDKISDRLLRVRLTDRALCLNDCASDARFRLS